MDAIRSASPAAQSPAPTAAPAQQTALPVLPLRTERLSLRGFVIDDLDDVHAYQSLPDVVRYLYRDPQTLERTREVLARVSALRFAGEGDVLCLAIQPQESTRVIGEVILKWISGPARQAEVGYILHPSAAGRGFATESTRAVVEAAFSHYGFHRVCARVDEQNGASAAVCRRLGMRLEARLEENDLRGGVWGTELVYAVLDREWHSTAR